MALNFEYASRVLTREIADLDIPDAIADEAVLEFQRVAMWLGAEESPLQRYDPQLYPQGSFRLGTPVRPVGGTGDFDIDLVCRLNIRKEQITQKDLKRIVGDRLKADEELRKRLKELRRCWTLGYQPSFHLDVLPCIPDAEMQTTGILLTDKELLRWQFSNPIGYANWFFDRMRYVLTEAQKAYARAQNINIEDVPEWRVRTPLQRAVQVLKRHRDVRFIDDEDRRPVSIIITTLAGHAYRH